MELFEIVFYPIEQLLEMFFDSRLTEGLGFSVPYMMIGLYIINIFVTVIFGLSNFSLNPVTVSKVEDTETTNTDIQLRIGATDAPQIGETRYLE